MTMKAPFYWKRGVPCPDRNVNYKPAEEPERRQRFVEFVHGQIRELMSGYGSIDILWLDGGQDVSFVSTIPLLALT